MIACLRRARSASSSYVSQTTRSTAHLADRLLGLHRSTSMVRADL